jgi:arylsulfatase A-like enzyme
MRQRRSGSATGPFSREDRPGATSRHRDEGCRAKRGARRDRVRAGAVPLNVLLVTLDQFRADCLSAAGHPLVRTPNLDRLAAAGVRLARHYSQAAPCGPGRACLYTGTYQLNNRVVGNGTPLDERFDNVARAAARAGYAPAVFGYADQAIDPAAAVGPDDPRLFNWESLPPGFEYELELLDDVVPWRRWLEGLGYEDLPDNPYALLAGEPERPAEHGISAFLTDHLIDWLERQAGPWFAHASYLRPHPPYAAAGHWSRAYDPALVPLPIPPGDDIAFCGRVAQIPAPEDESEMRQLAAQYYGMISDVDEQLGRVFDSLVRLGVWEDTCVVVTTDHGEQLGDQGRLQKGGYFESSYHILGIVRDPRHPATFGRVVESFTENVDIFPTICEAMGVDVPVQCDGLPLTPFLAGEDPPWWRDAAYWEYDWRWEYILFGPHTWPWDRRLERKHLAVRRTESAAYVQFADGNWRCFDLAADPTWRTQITDPATVLPHAQAMLAWRAVHAERRLTDMLLIDGGVGRIPPG